MDHSIPPYHVLGFGKQESTQKPLQAICKTLACIYNCIDDIFVNLTTEFKNMITKSRLKEQIRAGKITPEINDPNIRELVEGNYRIIYRRKSEESVSILTIHHIARDLNKRKGKFNK
ncbi:type II toxin-antitoxin system RelE/ParE family toxin [Echinicola strongylocentroti]|uniref:Type II toxin-antitoxin system RelE/ParE family toxin n=1 Tax=Echinicola strongylocentroti TaxID=1795355 RepID=A0A2Z4IMF8_9BACT|nr:type II toxin-antitoxin system RelE/ParE family toxin [Echinicola strongylocentroti]AWW32085.1 type II toxin-antitoxin system RelE/ParE family toxin [Echinicola strongylocentroti]